MNHDMKLPLGTVVQIRLPPSAYHGMIGQVIVSCAFCDEDSVHVDLGGYVVVFQRYHVQPLLYSAGVYSI